MSKQTNDKITQLVTFRLNNEIYGIEISLIQEVITFQRVTQIPNAPEFIDGVIQIRGRVIPVVDLKRRLGIAQDEQKGHRILILEAARKHLLGIIIDDISKVLQMGEENYAPLPSAVVDDSEKSCVSGLAKFDDELVIIISPENILNDAEKQTLVKFEEESKK